MMSKKYRCVVPHCDHLGPSNELSKFPSDQAKALKWVEALGLESFKPHSHVCHSHFDLDKDFIYGLNNFKRIKPNVVPTKNLSPPVSF